MITRGDGDKETKYIQSSNIKTDTTGTRKIDTPEVRVEGVWGGGTTAAAHCVAVFAICFSGSTSPLIVHKVELRSTYSS